MKDFTNYFKFKDWLNNDIDTGKEDWTQTPIEKLGLKPNAPPDVVRAFNEHLKETENARKHGIML